MKELTLKQIADWCGGKVSARFEHLRVSRMQSDSRKVRSGDLFVALKGAKVDGHDFAETAINHGAVAALVSRPISEKLPSIEVEDTLRAYGEIAAGYRKLTGVKVVGITGSVGKTTTKEMTASVLEAVYHTAKTEGNHNNNLGLPMTIMDMPENTEVAVLEMGMNHSGEMEYLSDIARPDLAIITNIGTMHIEHLGTREGILQAKLEIMRGMPDDGAGVFNGDEPLLWNIRAIGKHKNTTTASKTTPATSPRPTLSSWTTASASWYTASASSSSCSCPCWAAMRSITPSRPRPWACSSA